MGHRRVFFRHRIIPVTPPVVPPVSGHLLTETLSDFINTENNDRLVTE